MKLRLAKRNAPAPAIAIQSRARRADSPNKTADPTNSHQPILVYRSFDMIGSYGRSLRAPISSARRIARPGANPIAYAGYRAGRELRYAVMIEHCIGGRTVAPRVMRWPGFCVQLSGGRRAVAEWCPGVQVLVWVHAGGWLRLQKCAPASGPRPATHRESSTAARLPLGLRWLTSDRWSCRSRRRQS